MNSHLKTLFSSQSLKAWIAGLVAVLAAYLVPLISNWLAALTPEGVTAWFAGQGIELPYGLAAALVGLLGAIWTYAVKNRDRRTG